MGKLYKLQIFQVTVMRKGAEKAEVVGKTETVWRFFFDVNLISLKDLKHPKNNWSRTLEPLWTEGTMTIEVDESLEEASSADKSFLYASTDPLIDHQYFLQRLALGLWSRMTQKCLVCMISIFSLDLKVTTISFCSFLMLEHCCQTTDDPQG